MSDDCIFHFLQKTVPTWKDTSSILASSIYLSLASIPGKKDVFHKSFRINVNAFGLLSCFLHCINKLNL